MHPFPSKKSFIDEASMLIDNYPIAITKGIFDYFKMKNNAKVIYDGVLKKSNTAIYPKKRKLFFICG